MHAGAAVVNQTVTTNWSRVLDFSKDPNAKLVEYALRHNRYELAPNKGYIKVEYPDPARMDAIRVGFCFDCHVAIKRMGIRTFMVGFPGMGNVAKLCEDCSRARGFVW